MGDEYADLSSQAGHNDTKSAVGNPGARPAGRIRSGDPNQHRQIGTVVIRPER
jgi:hypothetical protein